MCIGIPMRIVETTGLRARCENDNGTAAVDLSLVGPQPPGTWVLVFHDAARQVLSAEDARNIGSALKALESVLQGREDVDHLFEDLVDREPPLPAHLRAQLKE